MGSIKEVRKDLRKAVGRVRRSDFSGDSGRIMKNSSYVLMISVVAKGASLAFSIILARILMPELYGLYTLAIATILIFANFPEIGFGTAVVTFASRALEAGDYKKAKKYYQATLKYKLLASLISSFILVLFAYFIANVYYEKPIFFALLVGGVYILVNSLMGHIQSGYIAQNDFRAVLVKEIIFRAVGFLTLPVIFLILSRNYFSIRGTVAILVILFTLSTAASYSYMHLLSKKKLLFLSSKVSRLSKQDNRRLKLFVTPLFFTALSGLFFGYIDSIMLGRYVSEWYLGLYGVAFGLIGAITGLVSFVGEAVLPVFSKIKNQSLERLFRKTRNITFSFALLVSAMVFFGAKYILWLYGPQYSSAFLYLRLFSLLILLLPLNALYMTYFISKKQTMFISVWQAIATVVNIILNYLFITYGLQFSPHYAVMGAATASILSQLFYLIVLVIGRRVMRKNKAF